MKREGQRDIERKQEGEGETKKIKREMKKKRKMRKKKKGRGKKTFKKKEKMRFGEGRYTANSTEREGERKKEMNY